MSNFYAAGYQESLTKLGATRWEQVFRESPEILEGALSAARQGHVSGTPSRLKSLESMKRFMGAKDELLNRVSNIPIADRNDAIQGIKSQEWANPFHLTNLGEGIRRRGLGMRPYTTTHQSDISDVYKMIRPEVEPNLLKRIFRAPGASEPAPDGFLERLLRIKIDERIGPTPNFPSDTISKPISKPIPKSNLKRNLLIGGGTLAGLGGATGIALPLALSGRGDEKTAEDYSEVDTPQPPQPSRLRSALGGALAGAGIGVIPAYWGSFSPKTIATVGGVGALLGGLAGSIFPNRTTDSSIGDIITGEAIPTTGSLIGGIGGAALGNKLFRGHVLGRVGIGFPSSVIGGFGGAALARKMLTPREPEVIPQPKEASEMNTDLMRVLLDDILKQAELKEEKTKSLHAKKYDRRMKFNTALERSTSATTAEAPLPSKNASDISNSFDGVTGREGVITVEDELLRTPPLPTEEPLEYDVGNKPVMQKESAEDDGIPPMASDQDLYTFTQRHPALLPILMGLGGTALGAIPGALLGGKLSVRAAKNLAMKSNSPALSTKDMLFHRGTGRMTGGLLGGLTGGALGTIGGGAMNEPQPWEQ
jgi:hypothetical protein